MVLKFWISIEIMLDATLEPCVLALLWYWDASVELCWDADFELRVLALQWCWDRGFEPCVLALQWCWDAGFEPRVLTLRQWILSALRLQYGLCIWRLVFSDF